MVNRKLLGEMFGVVVSEDRVATRALTDIIAKAIAGGGLSPLERQWADQLTQAIAKSGPEALSYPVLGLKAPKAEPNRNPTRDNRPPMDGGEEHSEPSGGSSWDALDDLGFSAAEPKPVKAHPNQTPGEVPRATAVAGAGKQRPWYLRDLFKSKKPKAAEKDTWDAYANHGPAGDRDSKDVELGSAGKPGPDRPKKKAKAKKPAEKKPDEKDDDNK